MADISKITLPSGTTYDIKDATARAAIDALSGYVTYGGVTTTVLTDGSTANPISINGENVPAVTGMIVTYQSKEFVWNGTAWQEFGDLSAMGNLAFADTASASYTPAGSVSLTNGNTTTTVKQASSGTATYTPAGSITGGTFTGASMTSTGSFTPSGSVSLSNTNKTATVSPASSGTATYTPAGSVAAPTISVATAGSTTTIKNPTSVTVAKTVTAAAPGATAPSNAITYYSVTGETLSLYQLGYTTGASITTSDVTVKTGDASYSANAPAFTGTGVRLVTGNISVPSSASFSGESGSVSVSGTTTGSVSALGFSGTAVRLVTDNISVPTSASFSGTAATITVTPDN